MKNPTREEVRTEVYKAVWGFSENKLNTVDRVTDAVMALYEDEPTTPKWETEFDKQVAVDTYGAKGFMRAKLKEFAGEIIGESRKTISKNGVELVTEAVGRIGKTWGL